MCQSASPAWCTAASGTACLLACACVACADFFSVDDGLDQTPACGSLTRGTLHDSLSDARDGWPARTNWTRVQSPHIIAGRIGGGTVVIEPGAVVCGQPGSTLEPDTLIAIGTADTAIVFMPVDSTHSWGGIRIPLTRPDLPDGGVAELVHVRIRRTSGEGVSLRNGLIGSAVLDSTCLATSNCAAIAVSDYSTTARVEDTTIRGSGGAGISVGIRSVLRLSGGSIEGSAGVGLRAPPFFGSSYPGVIVESPVRITGGGSYPAEVAMPAASVLTRDAAATAGVTGNVRDTLIVHSWPSSTASTIRKALPWRLHIPQAGGFFGNVVRVEAGATLDLYWAGGGASALAVELHVNGTALESATVSGHGAVLTLSAPDTVRVRHARLRDVQLLVDEEPGVFENVTLISSALHLNAPGSRFVDSSIEGAVIPPPFWSAFPLQTLTLGAGTRLERARVQRGRSHGIVVTGAGVVLSNCTVSDHPGDGVRVEQGGASISNCNLQANGGAGVGNLMADTVYAAQNWWGDPAGPFGPAGDGVYGIVVYEPFLTAPATPAAGLLPSRMRR